MANLSKMVGFLVTTNPDAARGFFTETLGFRLLTDDHHALAFDTGNALLRVGKAQTFTPAHGTVLGWEVADIHAAVTDLQTKGIAFERFPGMAADEHGIFTFPTGDQVAWFKDPEGNLLSLSQHVPV
jgi:catechol 2,3-dioxygenase-like lactoylglutathione lyase family enzyme